MIQNQNSKRLFAAVIAIMLPVAVVLIWQFALKNKTMSFNKINEMKNMEISNPDVKIEIFNVPDNRVLTNQGKQILSNIIKNRSYSLEAVRMDYSEWQPYVEKNIYAVVNYKEEKYIVPIKKGYIHNSFHFYEKDNKTQTDKISLNGFELDQFLDIDPGKVIEFKLSNKESYLLSLVGYGDIVKIKINGKEYPEANGKSLGGESFSLGIPINKFLVIGENNIEISNDFMFNQAELSVKITEMNKSREIFAKDLSADSNNPFVIRFNVQGDIELDEQGNFN